MKHIKSILYFIPMLFLTVAVLSFMTVEATDITAETGAGATVTATTELRNQPSFTLNIPSEIPVGNLERSPTDGTYSETEFTVSLAPGAQLGEKKVVVSISTDSKEFYLYNGSATLPYEVKQGATVLESDQKFATFSSENTAEVKGTIVIDRHDIRAEGTYSGILIFTVTVEEPTA